MRRGVIATRRFAPLGVDRRDRDLAGEQLTSEETTMSEETARDVLDVQHLEAARLGDDHSGVGDLAARLGVERCRIEEEFANAVLADE